MGGVKSLTRASGVGGCSAAGQWADAFGEAGHTGWSSKSGWGHRMSDTAQMTLDVSAAPEILVDLVDRPTLWSSLAHDAGLLADMDGLTDDEAAFQVSQAYIAT